MLRRNAIGFLDTSRPPIYVSRSAAAGAHRCLAEQHCAPGRRRQHGVGPIEMWTNRIERSVLRTAGLSSPVLDLEFLEAGEVLRIGSDEHEPIHLGDRSDLAVNVWRWAAERFQTRALVAVPGCSNFVVRKDRKGITHDVVEIALKRDATSPPGQPTTAVREFVPHGGRNRARGPLVLESLEDSGIGRLRDRIRHDAGIQEITKGHSDTCRPGVLSRVEATSCSRPMSSKEYLSRKPL